MKKLIFKYLNEIYYLHGITPKYISNDRSIPMYKISQDLSKIFGLTKKQTKWYLKGWCKKTNKPFLFNKAWNNSWNGFVTVSSNVYSLRASWEPTLVEDFESYHGIDIEAELTRLINEELNSGIAEEIARQWHEEVNP